MRGRGGEGEGGNYSEPPESALLMSKAAAVCTLLRHKVERIILYLLEYRTQFETFQSVLRSLKFHSKGSTISCNLSQINSFDNNNKRFTPC